MKQERGQALLMVIGAMLAIGLAGGVLVAYGQALGARGHAQRVADLAAMSAARVMRTTYPRLFEPAFLAGGVPNPGHITRARYLALARAAAGSAAVRNGSRLRPGDVTFPDGHAAAPLRVRVRVRRSVPVPMTAKAAAAIAPSGDVLAIDYGGALVYRQGKPMRPETAAAFDRLNEAARTAGVLLTITSAYRSDAEQARLFAAHPDPRWVAPPGRSLHRLGTELDLGPPGAYAWLAANAPRFGFVKRYSWEPWHFGLVRGVARAAPDGEHDGPPAPAFVPDEWRDDLIRASDRWNVPVDLLAAQLHAESNFNPLAVSPAGARGIAQFTPGTARAYGLTNAFDGPASIDAQAHLMHDLLVRFKTAALALAAYNAGPAAVDRYGGIPPFAETQAYVARVLGLMSGAGTIAGDFLAIRLVE
jgi:soluble lytic murein transglycosylase-like protein